jgi:hypothetical protein
MALSSLTFVRTPVATLAKGIILKGTDTELVIEENGQRDSDGWVGGVKEKSEGRRHGTHIYEREKKY